MSDAQVIGHYINGQVQDSGSERFSNVFNPATGSIQARVGLASQKTIDEAVAATADEALEASRSLKGAVLRQEVYAFDA